MPDPRRTCLAGWYKITAGGSRNGGFGVGGVSRHERIVVIGAGPAGIATAYELVEQGYEDVIVLERNPRVGGLCLSVGYHGRAYDLGANYVTSAYREIRRLAKKLDAPTYKETEALFFSTTAAPSVAWRTIFAEAKGDNGLFSFGWACLRYLWMRWRLGRTIPATGYAGITEHPDLMKSFHDWLRDNRLEAISTLCSIPVTLMGYGRLEDIPAPYVITYLDVRTFRDLLFYGARLPRRWPRRFVDGFQRLFERMSWHLDVRTSTEVLGVLRDDDGVWISCRPPADEGWSTGGVGSTEDEPGAERRRTLAERAGTFDDDLQILRADRLVLACPLQDALPFLDTSDAEKALIDRIVLNPFATSTYVASDVAGGAPALRARLVNVVERVDADPTSSATPVSIVTQQFPDSPLVTFYTPLPPRPATSPLPSHGDEESRALRKRVGDGVAELAPQIGLDVEGGLFSCDAWPYFPHVSVEDIADGWYDRIESLQGTNRTYYNGGVMCFELIEPIVEYSQDLVRRRIAGSR